MRSRMQSLDVVANNLANSSTSGYKSDGEFYSMFASEAASDDGSGPASGTDASSASGPILRQGLLEPTNNPLDFGISGKGFFVVQGPSGPLYTRNGNFRFDTKGQLVTGDGYPLLQQNGQPFQANPAAADRGFTRRRNQPERQVHRANQAGRVRQYRRTHQARQQLFSETTRPRIRWTRPARRFIKERSKRPT